MNNITDSFIQGVGIYFTSFCWGIINEKCAIGKVLAGFLATLYCLDWFQIVKEAEFEAAIVLTKILHDK